MTNRFAVHTACATLLAATALPCAAAQDFALGADVDFSTWSLLGSARVVQSSVASNLILTDAGSGDRRGAAFAPAPVLLDFNQPFSFSFNWLVYAQSPTDLRGDGMTFFLTPVSTPALGNGGSDLGYGGSGLPGYAFAFDTFDFGGADPASPSLQLLRDGTVTPLAATETGLGDAIRVPFTWSATVAYEPSGALDETGTLSGSLFNGHPTLQQTFTVSAPVDWSQYGDIVLDQDNNYLGREMYFGFTAANGLATDGHSVSSLTTPVPEPENIVLLLVGLALVGWQVRRARAAG